MARSPTAGSMLAGDASVFGVRREGGNLLAIGDADGANATRESSSTFIRADRGRRRLCRAGRRARNVLGEVQLAVQDWRRCSIASTAWWLNSRPIRPVAGG